VSRNHSKVHYGVSYKRHEVFNNAHINQSVLQQISLCEANLLQRKRELWYVINGERRPFGSFDVFQDLGFAVGCHVTYFICYYFCGLFISLLVLYFIVGSS
jgi:hypothetical protein